MSATTNDVAIYMPAAAGFYESTPDPDEASGGGAELQTFLLAGALSARGLATAHIVWPVREPVSGPGLPRVVQRGPYAGGRGRMAPLIEAREIWRGLARADAEVYVIRGGGPQLLLAGAFAAVKRRRLVFSSAIDLDFDLERSDRTRTHLALYRRALGRPDVVVVQTEQQAELARAALPAGKRLSVIPSFVEPAERAEGEHAGFVWIGRLVDYKRPLELARLAEALPELAFRMIFTRTAETPPGLVAELERCASRLGNLDLLGALGRGRVLEEIARSTAVVSTSRAEGLPNVFLEAWARGVPVASLDYDPDGRIAERGLGYVAGGSLERMAEQLRSLAEDSGARATLGENALAYVAEVHDPARVGAQWADLIDGLVRR